MGWNSTSTKMCDRKRRMKTEGCWTPTFDGKSAIYHNGTLLEVALVQGKQTAICKTLYYCPIHWNIAIDCALAGGIGRGNAFVK
jgi:hypothetical protein